MSPSEDDVDEEGAAEMDDERGPPTTGLLADGVEEGEAAAGLAAAKERQPKHAIDAGWAPRLLPGAFFSLLRHFFRRGLSSTSHPRRLALLSAPKRDRKII